MSFLTWGALAIALFAVVPILAHLLRRKPPSERAFSATHLVPATAAVAQRRTALEDRALLSLRVLAVLALALLGATPFVRCSRLSLSRSSGASIAVAVVIDDSLSMQARADGDSNHFERAQQAAAELFDSLRQGDAVAVVAAGRPARVLLAATSNLDAARTVVAALAAGGRGTDIHGAVKLAAELLGDLKQPDRRVVLLSDMLEAGQPATDTAKSETAMMEPSTADSPQRLAVPKGLRLWAPLKVLQKPIDDCAVVRADRSGEMLAVQVACSALARKRLAANGAAPASFPVEVLANDKSLLKAPIRMDRALKQVSLRLDPKVLSTLVGKDLWVRLRRPDAIAADDVAPVISGSSQLRAGIVTDQQLDRLATGGAPVVEQAFRAIEPTARMQPLAALPGDAKFLEAFGLLVVDDVPGFTPEQRRLLQDWVEKGGVLLLSLGPRAAAAPLGSGFAPLLPAILRWAKQSPAGLANSQDSLFQESFAGLDRLNAKGRMKFELQSSEGIRTLARWSDGEAFAVQNRMGRGVVYAVSLPFATAVSDFALRPGFLALLGRGVASARALTGVTRATVGHSWPVAGYRKVLAQRVLPTGKRLPVSVLRDGAGRSRVTAERLGLYQLELDGTSVQKVSTADPRELLYSPLPAVYAGTAKSPGTEQAAVDVSSELALLLLFLLLAELLLRFWGGRSSAAKGPAASSSTGG